MKAYLVTTGAIFALLTGLHVWRIIAEWQSVAADPRYLAGITAITVLCGVLAIWAWRLISELERR